MAEPSLQLGNGNWAGKSGNLLAYHKANNNFYADDLTFARASTGTIVNSDGLIEQVPYNLATYSEQFDNAAWTKGSITVTANTIASPDGSTNADTITSSIAGVSYIYETITVTSGSLYTVSVFAKAGATNFLQLDTVNNIRGAYFNLLTGVVALVESGTAKIENYGNGWYRCSVTETASVVGGVILLMMPTASGSITSAIGNSIFAYGAQINSGSTAKTYYPTTTRLNIPRVSYLNNANGSLLLESQRTNLVTYSEDFTSGWSFDDATITENSTISPSGILNGSLLKGSTVSSRHHIVISVGPANVSATFSLFVKAKELKYIQIASANTTNQYVNFDTENGTIGTVGSSFSNAKIEDYGNGWYRISIISPNQYNAYYISLVSGLNVGWLESWVMPNNTDGLYIWGAQVEEGSYSTSIIPTAGTTVTRLADTCATTGLSDVIGQTEGTMFLDFVFQQSPTAQSHIWLGSAGSEIGIYGNSQVVFYSSGGVSIIAGTFVSGQRYKLAFAYKANDYSAYVNGVQKGTDTSATVPATSALYINSYSNLTEIQKKQVNQVQLYKTRLSNTELATLTT